jgi:hypothetical protein
MQKGKGAINAKAPNFPLAHALKEGHVPLLDWMMDEHSPWI